MPRKAKRKYTRRVAKPRSDKFIVGMVVQTKEGPKLKMFPEPFVYDTYKAAMDAATEKYTKFPHGKFVVFAKLATIGAPFLAPKIEEWSF